MKLGRSDAEQPRGFKIRTNPLFCVSRNVPVSQCQGWGMGQFFEPNRACGLGLFIVGRERLQSVLPCIPVIWNVALEDTQSDLFSVVAKILQMARQYGYISELSLLGQKCADLEVRIEPFLQAAKQLEHQAFGIDDRAVALFYFHQRWRQRTLRWLPHGAKRSGWNPPNFTANTGKAIPSRNCLQQKC